jgi:hypothetical protein
MEALGLTLTSSWPEQVDPHKLEQSYNKAPAILLVGS